MLDNINGEIDIQIGPVKMVVRIGLDITDFCYRSIFKPREGFKRDKQLFALG